jgi:hypothetical protein
VVDQTIQEKSIEILEEKKNKELDFKKQMFLFRITFQ